MNDLNHNHLQNSVEFASKKIWEKPDISELKASLTGGNPSKTAVSVEQIIDTSPS